MTDNLRIHRRLRMEALAAKLFGELAERGDWQEHQYRFCCLTLDENNAPVIDLHDGRKDLARARWNGEKWEVKETNGNN